jgi:N-acetyl sugar amidotransferase
MSKKYCANCVMDSSDHEIIFNKDGVCNHCLKFATEQKFDYFTNEEGANRLAIIIENIRKRGKNSEYDCILGLSGGVDSSYLALMSREWGLRPLVIHVDGGWNSELAVHNIQAIVRYCNYDLHTVVVDWEEMRDLQISYLKSGVSNQDVPQDHIFFSSLYHFAIRNKIPYILSGGNLASEAVFPSSWHGDAMDSISLKYIHQKFGHRPLKNYKTISFFDAYFNYPIIRGMRTILPLNYIEYNKQRALAVLESTVGYKRYPRKHGESHFTKVFQNYYLPIRFGYDKRKPHLSSLILSGQITRAEANNILSQPLYDPMELEIDLNYVCKKLRITRDDFDKFLQLPIKSYYDYPNWVGRYRFVKKLQSMVAKYLKINLKIYS